LDSLRSAVTNNDLCEARLTDRAKCAPGWTPEIAIKARICDSFKRCIDSFNFGKDSRLIPDAQLDTSHGSTFLGFPKGWDAIDDFSAAWLKYKTDPKPELYGSVVSYHLANSILLGFSVVGAVFLVVGIIVETIGSGGKIEGV
jgi:hypothetical protein